MNGLNLGAALALGCGSYVSIIGGGGKTTTMLSLARWTASQGLRTAVTTTTKICPPDDIPLLLGQEIPLDRALARRLAESPLVAVAARARDDGKLVGLEPDTAGHLREWGADVVLCEADGSRRRPLKVHQEGEPVVPAASTDVLVVAGLDAVGQPISEAVHRHELLPTAVGPVEGDMVTPALVARCLAAASVHAPDGARLAFICNKADTPEWVEVARQVERELAARAPAIPVFVTSRGAVSAASPSLYS